MHILDARFVASASQQAQYPPANWPEIAFVGRSNVGKSSMINSLMRRTKMVRVSNTPGRTRTLNFFDVDFEHAVSRKTIRVCDLPGYGFAKVSKDERDQWKKMIERYLVTRPSLRVVVLVIDGEIGPTPRDEAMASFLQEAPPKILVVATKMDRVGKNRRRGLIDAAAKTLALPKEAVLGFSATDGTGWEDVWKALRGHATEREG